MYVIITGSMVRGFVHIGPFDSKSDAEKYAADKFDERVWYYEIDELFKPNENA